MLLSASLASPYRFVRRGRAAKRDDADFDYDIASDVEDTELISWLEKPGLGTALQLIQQPTDSKKMTKYLAPGTIADLFHHYESARKLIGAKSVSYPGL